ncbi:MAG: 1-deoxy-D-xylulose-5-phosphate reductoisomerase, partial [Selenomonadaceae bacterium]|nr:1-deoxy-D-xylulose-5-phosphate reductoisomerase [Selenomonadaceae bacterium]
MKKISILGSTGSVGTQALDVVRHLPEEFSVEVLTANSNVELFARQIKEFRPRVAVLADEAAYKKLSRKKFRGTELAGGRQALIDAAGFGASEIVLSAISGFAGLEPTIRAIKARKDIALANKVTLVVAGEYINKLAELCDVKILPVDSE